VKAMCELFGISRAAYYAWRQRSEKPDPDLPRLELIQEAYLASRRTYGYRRIRDWIEGEYGIKINHKAVLRLMRKQGIRSVARRKNPNRPKPGQTRPFYYPHLLQRDFHAEKPNQKWCTDITYVQTRSGWAYLSVIKDLFDGFIVSHRFSSRNDASLVTDTLKLAHQKEMVTAGTLLHSDQGHQYCCQSYYVLTQSYKLIPSMSRRGNCWDNAPIENFFSHLKEEAIRQYPILPFEETERIIDEYIYFYNYERLQLKTKQTPYQRRSLFM